MHNFINHLHFERFVLQFFIWYTCEFLLLQKISYYGKPLKAIKGLSDEVTLKKIQDLLLCNIHTNNPPLFFSKCSFSVYQNSPRK